VSGSRGASRDQGEAALFCPVAGAAVLPALAHRWASVHLQSIIANRQMLSTIQIPAEKTGLLIGKGGVTIKGINAQFGVKVIVQNKHEIVGPMADVKIEGEPASVEQAAAHIQETMATGAAAPVAPLPAADTAPPQEYDTYLDEKTGHHRLRGGALEIRDPTPEELAAAKR